MQKIVAVFFLVSFFLFTEKKGFCFPNQQQESRYIIFADKAAYKPGEKVLLKINNLPSSSHVRYWFLNTVIKREALTASSWNWQPPVENYRGYLVEVYSKINGTEKTLASIAIDVSSSWEKFPRYGFLSEFGQKSGAAMDSVIQDLSRNHINGLQFYDWQDKHHQPLAGTVPNPSASWQDIAGRQSYKTTVEAYINKAHQKGMQAMFYNLCYGALSDAVTDGVQPQWYLYNDATHVQNNAFNLPRPPFKSDILFIDPSNTGWQQYLAAKNNDVYKVFDFDGFHVDQVGERGRVYNYEGDTVNLGATFNSFLVAMKAAHPAKKIVMNAVNQYGQQGSIATAPVDFLYSELWTGNEGYKELAAAIQNNYNYSNGKSTVLAAYLNYNKAADAGTFNSPGVLLADAVIFAFGGSHIELGEHMLCREYFPNNHLQMKEDLKNDVASYYDFLTAYENLLRDGGTFNTVTANCINGKMNVNAWPPKNGKVAVQGKIVGSKQVLHFINFTNASTLEWRDTDGKQPTPVSIADATIEVPYKGKLSTVWVASPDINFGIPRALDFKQTGNTVVFTLPELKYWDMIVIEGNN